MTTKSTNLFFLFFLVIIYAQTIIATTARTFPPPKYKLSRLTKNIISLLKNKTQITITPLKNVTPSIGFFSADLKFDGKKLKFCEIGNGLYGVPLPSYSIINGKRELLYTPYWDLFWLFLQQFNLPIWYIGNAATNGTKTLLALGGKIFATINEFKAFYAQHYPPPSLQFKATQISDYTGILAYAGNRNFLWYKKFKNDFPNILFVNDFDNLFLRQKDKIHEFFNCDELNELRPRWKVYPHAYTPNLAQQIQQDIPAAYYVIKPSMGRKAQGVVMVEKEKLDQVLKTILQKTSLQNDSEYKTKDWIKTKRQSTFIAEEYIPSKTIFYEKKPYDPTLRAAFAVYYDQEKIVPTFFSCFWKKPPYSLNDNVSLTDQHITKSMVGCTIPGQEVNEDDMKLLTKIFNEIIPTIYEKMLINNQLASSQAKR